MTIVPIATHEEDLHEVGEALLPAVPARSQSLFRLLLNSGALPQDVGVDLAYLHLAAHVCLYGAVPNDVHLSLLLQKRALAKPEPRVYLMCASRDPQSLEWIEAARAGLATWAEPGFDDPLVALDVHGRAAPPVYPSFDTLIQHNLNRLKIHGALDRYLRLKRHGSRPPAM